MAKRKLANWIEGFLQFTAGKPTPMPFRLWSAISAVGAAMERRCWVQTYEELVLYPNLYIMLVAPAGIGKTICSSIIQRLFNETDEPHMASSSITTAAFRDELNKAERRVNRIMHEEADVVGYNSLYALINEFGVFLPAAEVEFMATLADLYDCNPFRERKRGGDIEISLPDPQVNLLGACTPSYLRDTIPPGSWEQGLMSRVIMIYSSVKEKRKLFTGVTDNGKLFEHLSHDLKQITEMFGVMRWEKEAAEAVQAWLDQGEPPVPEHPKLVGYNSRRVAHIIKLAQVASAAESNDRIITLAHYQTALGWLFAAERAMPEIFKAMTSGGDQQIITETYHYMWKEYQRTSKPLSKHQIVNFIQERAPAMSVLRIFDILVAAHIIKPTVDKRGGDWFIPTPPKDTLPS